MERVATLFNEANNPREWPGALDPFYGPGSNCMDWWEHILAEALGAEVVGLHGYTRGPDPAMVGNEVKFSDEPLTWQYVNYPGCVQTFLDGLDGRFPGAEVYITEYNHLWLEDELFPANPTIGWDDNATDVLDAAFRATSKMRQVFALIAYRWNGDDWKIEDKPQLLQKIVDLNK